MEQLSEWVRKTPKWLLFEIIASATALMANIIFIRGNIRLFLVVVTLIVVFNVIMVAWNYLSSSFARVPFEIIKTEDGLTKKTWKYPRWKRMRSVIIVIGISTPILMLVSMALSRYPPIVYMAGSIAKDALPVPPAQSDEFLVLVTKFDGEGEAELRPSKWIHNRLESDLAVSELKEARVGLLDDVLTTSGDAVRLGNIYSAAIIIWGLYDKAAIAPHYEVLQWRELVSLKPELGITTDSGANQSGSIFPDYVTKELGAQLSFLSWFTLGQTAYSRGNYSQALRFFDAAIRALKDIPPNQKKDLGVAQLYFFQGYIYQARISPPDFDKAKDAYARASSYDPDDPVFHYNLGDALRLLGENDKAVAEFTKTITLDPGYFLAYYNRGNVYLLQGRFQEAINDFDDAISIKPMANAYYARGLAYYQRTPKSLEDLKAAVSDLGQALRLDSRYLDAFLVRGHAYFELQEYNEAIADYEEVIRLSPQNAEAYNGLARTYTETTQPDLDKAVKFAQRAVELAEKLGMEEKKQAVYLDTLGWAYFKRGDTDLAQENLVQASQLWPENKQIQNHLKAVQ